MAETDPRQTLKAIIDDYLATHPVKKDDGVTQASVCSLWEGGPETLKHLFFVENYDAIITFGEPKTRSVREVQDRPVHYQMMYPFTVTTVNKPLTGVLLCTASRMQYKVMWALRWAIAASAQSEPAATPAYTLSVKSDAATRKRVGGINIWTTTHVAEYETDYGIT